MLVVNGRFAAISRERPDHSDAELVDLKGKVMMPGLIDCHFHAYACKVDLTELESLPDSYLAHRGRELLENALRRGFTTVRDAGGADYGLWRAIEEGVFDGPRLFYSGRAFSQTGGPDSCHSSRANSSTCAVNRETENFRFRPAAANVPTLSSLPLSARPDLSKREIDA